MRRFAFRILLALPVLFLLTVSTGCWYLRQSLPVISGERTVAGITGPVEIIRDVDAIPHVFASNKLDALFGLGYVHAQDRLWQMEFQRRIGFGRLSEVFGEATLPQDRFLRTVGFGRAARSAWTHLPEDVRTQVDAYVAGVNAFISGHHGRRLPPEFTLLRFEPEPFTGPDVLVWVKMMAWDLSANYSLELMRHDMLARVGADRMAELLPPYPATGLNIVPSKPLEAGAGSAAVHAAPSAPAVDNELVETSVVASTVKASIEPVSLTASVARSLSLGNSLVGQVLRGGSGTESLGSNNWVADGTLTASGKPMLANDPHLGTHVPSFWYLAHLSAGELEVIGATLPGAPAVAIGRNRFVAWGETNVAADVQDLFFERLDSSGTHAEFRGRQEPIRVVPETIRVKGRAPVEVHVRITRHGPLISDAINANNAESRTEPRPRLLQPIAFKWTALDDEDATVAAFLRLNEARNWGEFTSALRDLNAPAQNFVYADTGGHIGYYAPGRIPVRAGGDGSRPVEGWTGESEWTGWIPFDELPHAFDPPQHFIVTANNRPMPADYQHLIALEYPEPYRAERITELLSRSSKLTPHDFRDIQADTVSLHARRLLPLLLRHVRSDDAAISRGVELLRRWDFDGRGESAAEAVFQAWFVRLAPSLAGDELGPLVSASYEPRFSYITRFVANTLARNSSPWCDDVNTPLQETCEQVVTKALADAMADLENRLGSDISNWRWDRVHRAVFPHQGLDILKPLRPLLSRSRPNGGDWSTVNVGPVAVDALYEQRSVPGYRQIIDLSPTNDSRFLDALGESGHFLSPHYDDFLSDWQAVRHRKMRMDRADVESGARGRLRLVPAPKSRGDAE